MATQIVHEDRITVLHDAATDDGRGVIYWMQRAQRAQHNDALEHAVRRANELGTGLRVVFALDTGYPGASLRHFRFMLQGLAETVDAVRDRGIAMTVAEGDPVEVAVAAADGAALLVTDRAYQRHLVGWRQDVVGRVSCRVEQVESDVVVPVDVVSDKREYAARTIRSKINDRRDEYLQELRTTSLEHTSAAPPSPGGFDSLDLRDVDSLLERLDIDRSVGASDRLTGGTSQALAHLSTFMEEGLAGYGHRSPDPVNPSVSHLAPYLHYGQVSPVDVAVRVRETSHGSDDDREAFLEELLVRRELAANYVRHEADYDSYSALPDWARTTLDEHRDDEREHVYTASELEEGQTHDRAWNAAMAEVRETGYLHNHLRMFWGKQVVAWTNTPEHAFRTLLDLNNRYFLDGRDCSSYANVAWVFGLHDRAWQETDVRGKTRPMNRNGLNRKIDVEDYIADVESRLGITVEGD